MNTLLALLNLSSSFCSKTWHLQIGQVPFKAALFNLGVQYTLLEKLVFLVSQGMDEISAFPVCEQ